MKSIINLQPREKLNLSDVEQKMKSARNSNDYVLVKFGRKNEFIKEEICIFAEILTKNYHEKICFVDNGICLDDKYFGKISGC